MSKLLFYDERLLRWATSVTHKSSAFDTVIRFLARDLLYGIPILFLILWFWPRVKGKDSFRLLLLNVAASGVFAWKGVSYLIGSLWFRPRPDLSLFGEKELLFHRPDYSFPSDHAAFLFALSVSFYLARQTRLGTVFLVLGVVISIFRVIAGVHYPSDVLGGILVGALSAWLFSLIRDILDMVFSPIIRLFRMLHI